MKLRSRLAVASLALLGLLSACSSVTPAADAPPLEGTAWVLSSLPGQSLVPGSIVTLAFRRRAAPPASTAATGT